MKKHLDLAFKFSKYDFIMCFMRKWGISFEIVEHKIIYVEKRENNFVNNVEQKIILCKMQEIVYTENSEQFL